MRLNTKICYMIHDDTRSEIIWVESSGNLAPYHPRPPKSCRTFIMSSANCSGVAYQINHHCEMWKYRISWDMWDIPLEVGPKPSCDSLYSIGEPSWDTQLFSTSLACERTKCSVGLRTLPNMPMSAMYLTWCAKIVPSHEWPECD